MLHCSWDMMRDRCNCYFTFWAVFCPFTRLTARKRKILKKWKKHLEISSFYNSVPKIMISWYMVPEIWCITDVIIISHFGLVFCPFTFFYSCMIDSRKIVDIVFPKFSVKMLKNIYLRLDFYIIGIISSYFLP